MGDGGRGASTHTLGECTEQEQELVIRGCVNSQGCKHHRLGGSNHRHLLSLSPGGQTSENQVLVGLVRAAPGSAWSWSCVRVSLGHWGPGEGLCCVLAVSSLACSVITTAPPEGVLSPLTYEEPAIWGPKVIFRGWKWQVLGSGGQTVCEVPLLDGCVFF